VHRVNVSLLIFRVDSFKTFFLTFLVKCGFVCNLQHTAFSSKSCGKYHLHWLTTLSLKNHTLTSVRLLDQRHSSSAIIIPFYRWRESSFGLSMPKEQIKKEVTRDLHFYSNGSQEERSVDITLFIWKVIWSNSAPLTQIE
jgi:hypothetical protein